MARAALATDPILIAHAIALGAGEVLLSIFRNSNSATILHYSP